MTVHALADIPNTPTDRHISERVSTGRRHRIRGCPGQTDRCQPALFSPRRCGHAPAILVTELPGNR
jgi:hypothetical protein